MKMNELDKINEALAGEARKAEESAAQENHYENDNYDEYDGGEDLPGDSYDRGYSDGWDAGYEDGMEGVYEENFFIDENTSVDYRVGYAYGYGHGFEERQAELEN